MNPARQWALRALVVALAWSAGCGGDAPVAPQDTEPPAAVTDLAAVTTSFSSVRLSWTAPGDDGSRGTAAQYDLRYARSDTSDWNAMTRVTDVPGPHPAGTHETLDVTGLADSTAYIFRLRTADEVPSWSGLSNVAAATTPAAPDTVAPAPVTTLRFAYRSGTAVIVTWETTGDDGTFGRAAQYDLRYSTKPGTPWESMTQVEGEPMPSELQRWDAVAVEGLVPSTTYAFVLRVADERPNWSEPSNVASVTTTARAGDVYGSVVANLTWRAAASPIAGTDGWNRVDVRNGATLTIEPGVMVQVSLLIDAQGRLIADAAGGPSIELTGIEFSSTAAGGTTTDSGEYVEGSLLRNCVLGGVKCGAAPGFVDCTFRNSSTPLWVERPQLLHEVRLVRCTFEDNETILGPIVCVGTGALILRQCRIRNNRSGHEAVGALSILGDFYCLIDHTEITNNVTGSLGTIYFAGAGLRMTCSTMSGNTLTQDGSPPRTAGLYIVSGPETGIVINDCNLTDNIGGVIHTATRYSQVARAIDGRNVWWGTTDRGLIASSIPTCNGVPRAAACVQFEPFRFSPMIPDSCSSR